MQPIHDYYQNLAPEYDRDRFGNSYGRYVDRMEREILREWRGGFDPRECVEIACGTGRLLDFAMTGVDFSEGMLEQARAKYPDRRLVVADAARTGLPDGAFRLAYAFHLFMHLDRETCAAVLREAARIVRPGGSFIFDIPSAPRRALSGRPAEGWHGSTSASPAEIAAWCGDAWLPVRRRGVLFVPIHRFPSGMRPLFRGFDSLIGRSPLARWSSYYVCELRRR